MSSDLTDLLDDTFRSRDRCRRCGDTERFTDGDDTVCASCGATRWLDARPIGPGPLA